MLFLHLIRTGPPKCRQTRYCIVRVPFALFHHQPISPYLSLTPYPFFFLVFFYSPGDRLSRVRDYCVRRVTTILRNRHEDVVGTL